MSKVDLAKEQMIKRWKMHRNALIDLVDAFPGTSSSYRPWEDGMSTVELIHHLAWTPDFFFSAIQGRKWITPPVPTSMDEARSLLKKYTTETEASLFSILESDLTKLVTVEALNITEPVEDILHRFIGHEIHHKGQLMLYARLLNIKPPFYVDLKL